MQKQNASTVTAKVAIIPEERIEQLEAQLQRIMAALECLAQNSKAKIGLGGKAYFRIKEAAEYLCICRRKLEQLRSDKIIPYSQYGGYIVLAKDDLDAFIALNKVK